MQEHEMQTTNSGNSTMMILAAVGIVALIGVGAVMATRGGDTVTPSPTPAAVQPATTTTNPTVAPTTAPAATTSPAAGTSEETSLDVQTFDVEGGAFYYKPDVIKVKKGAKVKVVLKSVDMMHDFKIDELKVASEIAKAGETKTVEFVADKVGTFEYYCSVGQHRANGQVGKLIVE